MSTSETDVRTCYRHPRREAPLSCTRCGNPICLEDAIDAPVGYLCPDCAEQPKRVQQAHRAAARAEDPLVSKVFIGIMVALWLAEPVLRSTANFSLLQEGGLFGPAVAAGDWYRIITSGFLHSPISQGIRGLMHIGFNGYLLFLLGQMLERDLGPSRYLPLFLGGLFGGGIGALVLSYTSLTIGASGAVFGLMGAAMVGYKRRGINPLQTQVGSLVLLNLVFTFAIPNISIGGHIGGLAGGALVGLAIFYLDGARAKLGLAVGWAVAFALGVLALVVGIAGPPF